MRFYGSAMRMPHVHGAFRESLVCAEEQVYPISDGTSLEMAALAEPLAVCVHAVRQAGDLVGAARAGDRLRPDRRARHARGEARRGARDCRHRPYGRDPAIRAKDRSRPHRQHVFQSGRARLLHARQRLFRRRFRGVRRDVRAAELHRNRATRRRHRAARPWRRRHVRSDADGDREGASAARIVPIS